MDTDTLTALLALTLLAAGWAALVYYSKRTWPYLACRTCNGTGKDFEPTLLTWLCLRRQRAWRACRTCGGTAKHERR